MLEKSSPNFQEPQGQSLSIVDKTLLQGGPLSGDEFGRSTESKMRRKIEYRINLESFVIPSCKNVMHIQTPA